MSVNRSGVFVGIEAFSVGAFEEIDGELWVLGESVIEAPVGCPECGRRARVKDRPVVPLRDVSGFGRPVVLAWKKRRWCCPDRDCPAGSWTEQRSDIAEPRAVLTLRAGDAICAAVAGNRSVASLAEEFGVSWATAMTAVRTRAEEVQVPVDELEVAALAMDEHVMSSAHYGGGRRRFVTTFIDAVTGEILDMVEGNDTEAVLGWFAQRPLSWLDRIEVISADAHGPFHKALRATFNGDVEIVMDPFHVVRWANDAVDLTRRDIQRETMGRRSRQGDPMFGIRHLVLVGRERLTEPGRNRLAAGLAAGDLDGRLTAVIDIKELVRSIYQTDDPAVAAERLQAAIDACAAHSDNPRVRKLGRSLRKHADAILARHRTGISNGRAEAINLSIKNVKRCGRGFRNFNNYRTRVMLVMNRSAKQPIATSLRGHAPRAVA